MTVQLPDEAFWNKRYVTYTLGSGPGSRGVYADKKLSTVQNRLEDENITSIIDLGCGDIYWIKHLNTQKYIGVDFSQTIIEKNQKIKPGWVFKCIDFSTYEVTETADLGICLDVLIHQPTLEQYNMVIENALNSSEKELLISGWSLKPEKCNATMYFYETVFEAAERLGLQHQKIYSYRESSILRVVK